MSQKQKLVCLKMLFIAAVVIITGFLFPWWMFPVAAFALGVGLGTMDASVATVFGTVFGGVALGWALVALAFDVRSGFHLSVRIGGMFKLGFPLGGVIIAALIGAVVGAFFALAGASLRIGVVRVINDRA